MALDSGQIVVGGTGHIYTADLGSTAPTTEVSALAAGWLDLGYTTDDGVTFTPEWESEDLMAWQSQYPVRRLRVSQSAGVGFTLMQWNVTTVPFGFGGGTVTEPTSGHFKYTPGAPGATDERGLIVEWVDDTKNYRLVIPKGETGSLGDVTITRSGSANLETSFSVLGTDGSDPWYLLTDDPSFEALV